MSLDDVIQVKKSNYVNNAFDLLKIRLKMVLGKEKKTVKRTW